MNILLADSNRDLLQCYEKLLGLDGHTVTTAFDGTQVAALLEPGKYDIAILEQRLPRMALDRLLQDLERARIPVIVLTEGPVTVKTLLETPLPNAYLIFPFLPEDLKRTIREVTEKARSTEILRRGGVAVDVGAFRIEGTAVRLTNGEINLLRELSAPRRTAGKRTRVMIQALNEKLKSTGKNTEKNAEKTAQIIYEMEKGYRLVNENE
ncbi:MAG: hypothetical protein IJQ33_03395 [Clostridia bacterium]|nr:hypothetical protein [Clostridia bacterium]